MSRIAVAVCFAPDNMGLDEMCKIYYFDGNKYVEVMDWDGQNIGQTERIFGFWFGKYRAFALTVPKGDESTGVKLIFVNE